MNWKKYLLIGFGMALGIVIACAVLFFVVTVHSSRKAREWNTDAIRTEYATVIYRMDHDFRIDGITQEYVVENKSGADYTLQSNSLIMIASKGSYSAASDSYKLAADCFIPAGQKVKCDISFPAIYDTSWSDEGFAIFDTTMRYKIELAKPRSPSQQERKNAEEELKNDFRPVK